MQIRLEVLIGSLRSGRTICLKQCDEPVRRRACLRNNLFVQAQALYSHLQSGARYMNLLITGHHIDVTPTLREYVKDKLEPVTRHFDQIIDVAVVLGVEKPAEKEKRQYAEVNLRIKGNMLHVEDCAEDLYAAIDGMMAKLDRQVLKYKEKVQDHQHEPNKHANRSNL